MSANVIDGNFVASTIAISTTFLPILLKTTSNIDGCFQKFVQNHFGFCGDFQIADIRLDSPG